MKTLRYAGAALLLLTLTALSASPAAANFCGGSTAWKMLSNVAFVQYANPALQERLWFYERWQVQRDLALLETTTVGQAQIDALDRLVATARAKLGRDTARPYASAAYELIGKAYHIMAEHNGDLEVADRAEGNVKS